MDANESGVGFVRSFIDSCSARRAHSCQFAVSVEKKAGPRIAFKGAELSASVVSGVKEEPRMARMDANESGAELLMSFSDSCSARGAHSCPFAVSVFEVTHA